MHFIQQRGRDVQNWLAKSGWYCLFWVEQIYRACCDKALPVSLSVGSKTPSHSIEGQVGEVDSLAPFQGANAIPCPLGMDIE